MTTVKKRPVLTLLTAAAALLIPAAGPSAPVAAAPDVTAPDTASDSALARTKDPQVIAHRGASGYRPEHTLAAYRLAIRQGADFIEPDLVSTSDGVLVARHENEISSTTDVADRPRFADRKTTKTIDGAKVTGWFTEDFTLAELRTLRAKERLPQVRPDNTAYDGRYKVPTLHQILRLARRAGERTGREIGVYPETKHPTYFDSIGLSLEEPLLAELSEHGLNRRSAKVRIQSFETGNLRDLDRRTSVRLVQLVDKSGAPYDLLAAGDKRTYADLITPAGLRQIRRYADGLGAQKDLVLPRDAAGAVSTPSSLVRDAHRAGLPVHVWTLRAENQFMATNFRRGSDPNAHGDMVAETRAFLRAGVDGVFADHPDLAVRAVSGRY